MYSKKYDREEHNNILKSWLKARDHYLPVDEEMPETGLIAYYDNIPAAAVFLRKVEGGYGQIDGLTSNPDLESSVRSDALDMVINHILIIAKNDGIKQLISFTSDKNTLLRSLRHGFAKFPTHTVVMIDLNSRS